MILRKYILNSFASSFFPIFIVLFSIVSLINLIKLASLTAVVDINFWELGLLYSYALPRIIYIVLPVSFFLGAIVGLSKLTSAYELLVLSTIGLKPTAVLKVFLPFVFMLSLILIVLSQIVTPKAVFLSGQFIKEKQLQAVISIKASQFGQKFGDKMVFIESKDGETLNNIKLFEKTGGKSTMVIANKADIKNNSGFIELNLYDGFGYWTDILNQTQDTLKFEKLSILNPQTSLKQKQFRNFGEYWHNIQTNKGDAWNFALGVCEAFMPISLLFFVIVFGYFNPRFNNNRASMYGFGVFIAYVFSYHDIAEFYPFTTIVFVPLFWFLLSYFVYTKTTKIRY
jgi:lipopolysaccharide export system permease protein